MSFIAVDFLYHFSNFCGRLLTKAKSKGNAKTLYCWFISMAFMAVPVSLDLFSDLSINYGASRGICFIEPELYQIIFFLAPILFLICINNICFFVTLFTIYNMRQPDVNVETLSNRHLIKLFAKVAA
jgi:hypothetical protein